jgi:hypothetical protein
MIFVRSFIFTAWDALRGFMNCGQLVAMRM